MPRPVPEQGGAATCASGSEMSGAPFAKRRSIVADALDKIEGRSRPAAMVCCHDRVVGVERTGAGPRGGQRGFEMRTAAAGRHMVLTVGPSGRTNDPVRRKP